MTVTVILNKMGDRVRQLKQAIIERINDKQVRIQWDKLSDGGQVTIFRSLDPKKRATAELIGSSDQGQILLEDQKGVNRYYYLLDAGDAPGNWIAERLVIMEGTVNFRDMGGYQTIDERQTRWGILFRGDSLQRATENDQELVKKMNIGQIFDFRRPEEVKKGPNLMKQDHIAEYHHLPVVHGEFNFMAALEKLKANEADWIKEETIIKGYIDNTVNFAEIWGKVIQQLAQDDCPPLFFHCTAGKDRTGICAALILSALNIPRATILADYLLSNPCIRGVWQRVQKMIADQGVNPKKLEPFFTAPEYAMNALLDHLEQNYNSPLNFLKTQAGIEQETIDALKVRLLES